MYSMPCPSPGFSSAFKENPCCQCTDGHGADHDGGGRQGTKPRQKADHEADARSEIPGSKPGKRGSGMPMEVKYPTVRFESVTAKPT